MQFRPQLSVGFWTARAVWPREALQTAALLLLLGSHPARADTAAGLADFQDGRFAEAFQQWTNSAAAGDARGALFIGALYDTGLGVGQDYGRALEWYRRAADAGSAAGMFNVAVMHDSGRGVPSNPAEAAPWYERAAALGFARAEYNLGLLYEDGSGVPRSRARAVEWFTRAARHGITAAAAHLQQLGQNAVAAGKPASTVLTEFQQAQQILLSRGPAEAARAAEYFRRAAEHGSALAEYDLAYCYEHGFGVTRDPAQARQWYQRAAGQATDETVRSLSLAGARSLEGGVNVVPALGASRVR